MPLQEVLRGAQVELHRADRLGRVVPFDRRVDAPMLLEVEQRPLLFPLLLAPTPPQPLIREAGDRLDESGEHGIPARTGERAVNGEVSRDGRRVVPDQLFVHVDRREDIPPLLDHFLHKFCAAMNRPEIPRVTPEAMSLLMNLDWPGNARELENAVERALVVGRGLELRPADFSFQLQTVAAANGRTLEDVERAHIEHVWGESSSNHSLAARVLGIDRTTLYKKLKRYGLE